MPITVTEGYSLQRIPERDARVRAMKVISQRPPVLAVDTPCKAREWKDRCAILNSFARGGRRLSAPVEQALRYCEGFLQADHQRVDPFRQQRGYVFDLLLIAGLAFCLLCVRASLPDLEYPSTALELVQSGSQGGSK